MINHELTATCRLPDVALPLLPLLRHRQRGNDAEFTYRRIQNQPPRTSQGTRHTA